MNRKIPLDKGEEWEVYDFRSERGTYVFRNLEEKKYTPIPEEHVRKCTSKIMGFLTHEYNEASEYDKCRRLCKQPRKRFLIAAILLLDETKIEAYNFEGKVYLKVVKDEEPLGYEIYHSFRELISVSSKDVSRLLLNKKDEDRIVSEEYRQYRETYGR